MGTRGKVLSGLALAFGALTGCGAEMNINELLWRHGDDGAEAKLQQALIAYDRKEFGDARKLAGELLAVNPDNALAATVVAYSYLSEGGMDLFRLVNKLADIDKTSTSTATSASTGTAKKLADNTDDTSITFPIADDDDERFINAISDVSLQWEDSYDDESYALVQTKATATSTSTSSSSESSSSDDAQTTLKKLGEILNISAADINAMTSGKFQAKTTLFSGGEILVPKSIDDTVRNAVSVLSNMNASTKAMCRFIGTKAREQQEARHAACAATKEGRLDRAKALFVWSIAHLTESIVYQSVLLYTTTSSATSNFQAAVSTINGANFSGTSGLNTFIDNVTDLKDAVDKVFSTDANSMLSETMRNLKTVNVAFGQMGLPKQFTSTISSVLEKLDQVAGQFGNTDKSKAGTQALKTQITESFSKTVGEKASKALEGAISENSAFKQYSQTNPTEAEALKKKLTQQGLDSLTTEESTLVFGSDGTKKAEFETQLDKTCDAYGSLSKDLPDDTFKKNKPSACDSTSKPTT